MPPRYPLRLPACRRLWRKPRSCSARSSERRSEIDFIAALGLQQCARFGGARDVEAQFLQNAANLADLLGIRSRKPALAGIQAVLEPDADIAAENGAQRDERQLMPPRRQH